MNADAGDRTWLNRLPTQAIRAIGTLGALDPTRFDALKQIATTIPVMDSSGSGQQTSQPFHDSRPSKPLFICLPEGILIVLDSYSYPT